MILLGNALDLLKDFTDESIDCVVTSPPYWALRDYKVEGSIWDADPNCDHDWTTDLIKWHSDRGTGKRKEVFDDSFQVKGTPSSFCSKCPAWKGSFGLEPTFQLYIKHMLDIFDQIKRVLKKEGTCWVVLGDTYAGTKIGNSNKRGANTRSFTKPISEEVTEKSLCLIPQRFAIGMIDRGWILRNDIIWHKPNCMPSSATDRFTVDYEHIFFFVKSQRYYFKTQYEDAVSYGKVWGGMSFKPTAKKSITIREGGDNIAVRLKNRETWNYFPNGDRRIKRAVWNITTQPYPDAHFAVFPEELIETPIIAGCPEGGTVLDPFSGSGTTLLAAHKLLRNFIGIEINPEYVQLAKKRLTPYVQQQRLDDYTNKLIINK